MESPLRLAASRRSTSPAAQGRSGGRRLLPRRGYFGGGGAARAARRDGGGARIGGDRFIRQAEHARQAREAGLEGKVRKGLGLGLEAVGEGPVEVLALGEGGVEADGGGDGGAQLFLAGLNAPARLSLGLADQAAAQGDGQAHGPAHAVEGDQMDGRIAALGLDGFGPLRGGSGARHGELGELGQQSQVARDLGLGRVRTLSPEGRELAAQRWYDGDGGPDSPLARSAPDSCSTCGFLMRVAGPLAETFGVCANGDANDDGRIVSFDHGCGAHSEVRLAKRHEPQPLPEPVVDTINPDDIETF